MDKSERRRQYIKKALTEANGPVTASHFADTLDVSRQIIVGDVAILRASGMDILATPKGYVYMHEDEKSFPYTGLIACQHGFDQLRDELYTIVDFGATVIDVAIEHAVYGEISAKLDLSSRYDVDNFMNRIGKEKNSAPISSLTDGVHLHRIGCRNKETLDRIKAKLSDMGIAIQ